MENLEVLKPLPDYPGSESRFSGLGGQAPAPAIVRIDVLGDWLRTRGLQIVGVSWSKDRRPTVAVAPTISADILRKGDSRD